MPQALRLFIAIELTPEIHAQLGKLIDAIKPFDRYKLNWVKAENIHLTLKFLGDTPESAIPSISQALTLAAQQNTPFSLSVSGTGCFPSPRQPRVFWAGLQAPPQLNRLQKDIDQSLLPLHIAAEKRPFSPHLTLARVPESCPPESAAAVFQQLLKYQNTVFGNFQVDRVTLFKSTLTRQGAIYQRLVTFSLRKTD